MLKRTFYSAGTREKVERKGKKKSSNNQNDDQLSRISFVSNDDDPLMDYDDRDSSESEAEYDVTLDLKVVELVLRSLSTPSECDHVNISEQNLPPHAIQLLATIVRCKQLCCYVKRVFSFLPRRFNPTCGSDRFRSDPRRISSESDIFHKKPIGSDMVVVGFLSVGFRSGFGRN